MEHRAALEAYKNKDFQKAHDIWVEEAKLKNDQAMANLGLMYLKGEGVTKDYTKAKSGLNNQVLMIMIRLILI